MRRDDVASRRKRLALWGGVAVAAVIAGLYALSAVGGAGGGASEAGADNPSGSSGYKYAVGLPGPGEPAPPIELASTTGKAFDLAAYKGKENVLLYFQEGLMCQPCWDQIVAIERELPKFKAVGIGPIVSITGDPLRLIEQKAADEGIRSMVLADPGYTVSDAYDARSYGMMSGQMAGHSFILVGKNGRIMWRGDYGGAPDYTMFVPTDALLTDLRQGLKKAEAKQPA
jgi:peroxiredoxin Q/BCP